MDIILPNIGETVDEGKVLKWLKQVGDHVTDGDVLCEVETDKSTMEVPTTIDGTIKEIRVKEGDIVIAAECRPLAKSVSFVVVEVKE